MSGFLSRYLAARRVVAAVLIYLLISPTAYAFSVSNHKDMTRPVLKDAGFSPKSADAAIAADWQTDIYEVTKPEAHFDDEQLSGGSARLRAKIDAVIDHLLSCDKKGALEDFGKALHTAQDFYSHSNWSDHNTGVYPGGIYDLSDPSPLLACSRGNDFAKGSLTSGYFDLAGYLRTILTDTSGQCDTTPPNKCCHLELNKDKSTGPFDFRFARAFEAAGRETDVFERKLEGEILKRYPGDRGAALIKLLKKDQRDVSFVIDDTGSMSEDIAGVKAAVSSLADQIAAGNEAPRFSLYTFKDETTLRGTTCDVNTLKSLVAPLFASGGGDCPEMSNQAMLSAADTMENGGQIIMATDASARDPETAPTLLSVVQAKRININVILTGNCVFDPAVRTPETTAAARLEATATGPVIPPGDLTSTSSQRIFGALTALSGGMFFRVNRSELPQAASIILNRTRPGNADMLYAIDVSDGVKSYDVPVDSMMSDVTFVASRLQSSGAFALTITRPNGNVVAPGDPGVTFTNTSGVNAIRIAGPAAGQWRMSVSGAGRLVASVFGESSLNLTNFGFLQRAAGQRDEVDFVPLPGLPVAGAPVQVEAVVDGNPATLDFALRNPDATAIAPIALDRAGEDRYQGNVTAPASDFLVYATGLDANGARYQRVFRQFFKGQSVRVSPRQMFQTAAPGSDVSYLFDVTNLGGTPMTYVLRYDSSSRYRVIGPAFLSLGAGETKSVTLTVTIPPSALDGSDDSLSLVVTSTSDPGVTNNAVVTTIVSGDNTPPNVAGAVPSADRIDPPNGKFVPIAINGVTDPDGDPVTITISSIRQDEAVNATGDGNTCPDAGGVGTSTALLRAERSGTGDGRIYEIGFTASDGRGGVSSGSVRVCVPRDQGQAQVCTDSGLRIDSTVCP